MTTRVSQPPVVMGVDRSVRRRGHSYHDCSGSTSAVAFTSIRHNSPPTNPKSQTMAALAARLTMRPSQPPSSSSATTEVTPPLLCPKRRGRGGSAGVNDNSVTSKSSRLYTMSQLLLVGTACATIAAVSTGLLAVSCLGGLDEPTTKSEQLPWAAWTAPAASTVSRFMTESDSAGNAVVPHQSKSDDEQGLKVAWLMSFPNR